MDDPSKVYENPEKVLSLLANFSEFGKLENGGISRLAASAEDGLARDYLCVWLQENGYEVLVDQVGNIFGIIHLTNESQNGNFFCGSHLDSQPNGGRFDGTLGVATACAAGLFIRDAVKSGRINPDYQSYVVVCWTGEEGARFQPSLLGSSSFVEILTANEALSIEDDQGISLSEALKEIGYCSSDVPPTPAHYFELHIEQGTRLEKSGRPVGLVDACWGSVKLLVEITGRPDHTGPTPMEERRDALLAASHLIVRVSEISKSASATLHSSVGRIESLPNSPNTVTDHVRLWIEFRSKETKILNEAKNICESALSEIQQESSCTLKIVTHEERDAIAFDKNSFEIATKALYKAGIPYETLSTIAGHDAIRLQSICPSTLMFVPSKNGVSHSPEEYTSDQDIAAGYNGMLHAISALIAKPRALASTELLHA